jgi:uncharacterized membrane protein YphA (DoxX/SURF4 family)
MLRLILGGLLLFSGISKVGYIDSLIIEIQQYKLLPDGLELIYGNLLPYIEMITGTLLILGVFKKPVAVIASLLFLSFTIAKIYAIVQGFDINICNCFGPAMTLLSTQSLAIDVVMIVISIYILFSKNNYFTIQYRHKKKPISKELI